MKKIILSAVFVISLTSVVFAQVPPTDDFDTSVNSCVDLQNNLSYRSRDINTNGEVSLLQDFLNPTYLSVEPSGFFGISTVTAVKRFQSANGLVSIGRVGPATRAMIKNLTCGSAISVPTVEFIGAPMLNLQYDSAGKESVLVGKATVKITAGNSAISFYNGYVGGMLRFVSNGKDAYSNSINFGEIVASISTPSPTNVAGAYLIPAYTSLTFNVTNTVPTKELFAGAYSLQPTDLIDTNGTSIKSSSFIHVVPSNSVTIVGETSPYMSFATVGSNGDVMITGSRLNLPENNLVINSQDSGKLALLFRQSNGTNIVIPKNFFDAGIATLLIKNSVVGDSNIIYINIPVDSNSSATADLKVNGSDGPLALSLNQRVHLAWKTTGMRSCSLGNVNESPSDGTDTSVDSVPLSGEMDAYYTGNNPVIWLSCFKLTDTTTSSGSDGVFLTSASVYPPQTRTATEITPTGAILNMLFNTAGQSFQTYFNWGTSLTSLTNEVRATNTLSNLTSRNSGYVYSASILGLSPNTQYFYQANAKENATGRVSPGSVFSFMTLGVNKSFIPTLNFYADSNDVAVVNIVSGQPAHLRWSTNNVLLCNATGAWSGMKSTTGVEVVYPQQSTIYTLSCGGTGGETNSVSKSVVVKVISNPTTCPNGQTLVTGLTTKCITPVKPDVSFSVYPQTVSAGGSVNVFWSAKDATNCIAKSSPDVPSWSGSGLGIFGSKTVTGINQTTMLYVLCSNETGLSTSQGVQVAVSGIPTANQAKITDSGVTFVTNSSPVAQYVLGNSNLAIAKFNIKTSNGISGAILKDLVFTVPANTISSLTVNGRTVGVIGTTVTLIDSGIAVPADGNGVDLNVVANLACADPTAGCVGVSSSVVNIALSSLSYNDGQISQPAIITTAKTPDHILVVSKPTITLNSSTSGTFGNGVSKIGEFTISADPAGKIELKYIPINIIATGGVSIIPNSVVLRDSTGSTTITGTNALSGSGNFIFPTPRQIARGTSETYTVYANITGVTGPVGNQSVTFSLGNKSYFVWNDVFGSAINLKGDLIFNYPSSSQTSISLSTPITPIGTLNITPTNCIIPANSMYCSVNMSWTVNSGSVSRGIYATDDNYLGTGKQYTRVVLDLSVRSDLLSGSEKMTMSKGVTSLSLRSGGTTVLSTVPVTVTCENGTSFDISGYCRAIAVTPTPLPVAPTLTVLSPNIATPSYKTGSTMLLKWRTPADVDSVALQVHDNSSPYKSFYTGYGTNTVTNSDGTREGSMTITIPTNAVPGMYTLYISTATLWDESDAYFQVISMCSDLDMNGDGVVTQADVDYVKSKSGTSLGGVGYDAKADLNGDNMVNSSDISRIKFSTCIAPTI